MPERIAGLYQAGHPLSLQRSISLTMRRAKAERTEDWINTGACGVAIDTHGHRYRTRQARQINLFVIDRKLELIVAKRSNLNLESCAVDNTLEEVD